jgi:hypothetical protein
MINAIDKRTRSTLGLAALACLLIAIWFPSVLSDNLQQVEMSELLSGLVGSAGYSPLLHPVHSKLLRASGEKSILLIGSGGHRLH